MVCMESYKMWSSFIIRVIVTKYLDCYHLELCLGLDRIES